MYKANSGRRLGFSPAAQCRPQNKKERQLVPWPLAAMSMHIAGTLIIRGLAFEISAVYEAHFRTRSAHPLHQLHRSHCPRYGYNFALGAL